MGKIGKVILCSLGLIFWSVGVAEAGICFLPDCGKKLEGSQGNANRDDQICHDEGFVRQSTPGCPPNTELKSCSVAPDRYFKCDAEAWCRNNGFTVEAGSCAKPKYPQDKCPSFDLYKSCVNDTDRACKEIDPDYTDECADGWRVDGNQTCKYDYTYGICCNLCAGYNGTSDVAPQGYKVNGSCDGCDGLRYKLEALPCPTGYSTAVTSCGSGYSFSTDGYSGSQRCGKCTASGPVCPDGYTSTVPVNYGHRGDLAVANGNKTAWCFPSGAVFYDSRLASIGKRQTSIYQINGGYTFTNQPYFPEIEYMNGSIISGDVSFTNIYSFGGTLTFRGNVRVLGRMFLASGAKVCFQGGVSFQTEIPGVEPMCNWTGWSGTGGACRVSNNCYY